MTRVFFRQVVLEKSCIFGLEGKNPCRILRISNFEEVDSVSGRATRSTSSFRKQMVHQTNYIVSRVILLFPNGGSTSNESNS